MKEERFFYVPDANARVELPEEESKHAVRVLRLHEGDEIFLMDGEGMFYQATITTATPKKCLYKIEAQLPQEKTWNGRIHLAIAPTKNMDRMEWLVEKATEIGFDELTLLDCRFSERHQVRIDRLERIVLSAVKQSRKAWLPKMNAMTPFRDFIQQHRGFIAHCYDEITRADLFNYLSDKTPTNDEIVVMIGPEGDFSVEEVNQALQQGFQSVTLGQSRLRTETAGLAAVTFLQLLQRK